MKGTRRVDLSMLMWRLNRAARSGPSLTDEQRIMALRAMATEESDPMLATKLRRLADSMENRRRLLERQRIRLNGPCALYRGNNWVSDPHVKPTRSDCIITNECWNCP